MCVPCRLAENWMVVWTKLSDTLAPIWLRSQAPRAWPHTTGPWAAVSRSGRSCSVGGLPCELPPYLERAVTEALALRAQASSHRVALVPSLLPPSTLACGSPGSARLGSCRTRCVCSLPLGTMALTLALSRRVLELEAASEWRATDSFACVLWPCWQEPRVTDQG